MSQKIPCWSTIQILANLEKKPAHEVLVWWGPNDSNSTCIFFFWFFNLAKSPMLWACDFGTSQTYFPLFGHMLLRFSQGWAVPVTPEIFLPELCAPIIPPARTPGIVAQIVIGRCVSSIVYFLILVTHQKCLIVLLFLGRISNLKSDNKLRLIFTSACCGI